MLSVSEQLRRAIDECGVTRYQISKETGIPASILSRFVAAGKGLRSENLDKLCDYLELTLTPRPRKTRRKD